MKKLLNSIVLPVFCLFVAGALSPSAQAIDAGRIQEATVRIVTDKGMGSGAIINEHGNILTSQHVIEGATVIFALRCVGGVTRVYKCKCEPAQQNKEVDLAVLSSSIKAGFLTLNTAEPQPTAEAFTAGFPGYSDAKDDTVQEAFIAAIVKHKEDPALEGDGVDVTREMSENKRVQDMVVPSFSTGQVRRMGTQVFQGRNLPVRVVECDIPTGHGSSGGPLMDAGGFLIGVIGQNHKQAGDVEWIPDGWGPDKDGKIHMVPKTVGVEKVNWAVSETEIERFLADRQIALHKVTVDVAKLGHWSTKQKILVSVACACAVIAAGLAFFLIPRQQPAAKSTPTVVIAEKMRRIMEEQGLVKPLNKQPQVGVGSVWELDIQGPGGFRQNVRLTDADFKRGRGRVIVGRNSDFSDVPVKHESVSRQHLHFEIRDTGIVVADRHSSNGTKVNGKSLAGPFRNRPLKEGDSIQFGELTASVRRGF